MSQLEICSRGCAPFLIHTSNTLEAHAPVSLTTFRSSDTEIETKAHCCLGMTAHHPTPQSNAPRLYRIRIQDTLLLVSHILCTPTLTSARAPKQESDGQVLLRFAAENQGWLPEFPPGQLRQPLSGFGVSTLSSPSCAFTCIHSFYSTVHIECSLRHGRTTFYEVSKSMLAE
jgi:hypothetical protein